MTFATVAATMENIPDFELPEWSTLFGDCAIHLTDEEDEEFVEAQQSLEQEQFHDAHSHQQQGVGHAMGSVRPIDPLLVPPATGTLMSRTNPLDYIPPETSVPPSDHQPPVLNRARWGVTFADASAPSVPLLPVQSAPTNASQSTVCSFSPNTRTGTTEGGKYPSSNS